MSIERYYRPLEMTRMTTILDAVGDVERTETDPVTFMGYVGKPSSAQAVTAGQRGVDVDGRLYAPVSAGIQAFDCITEESGRRWQVVTEPRDVAGRGHHVEAGLRALGGERYAG